MVAWGMGEKARNGLQRGMRKCGVVDMCIILVVVIGQKASNYILICTTCCMSILHIPSHNHKKKEEKRRGGRGGGRGAAAATVTAWRIFPKTKKLVKKVWFAAKSSKFVGVKCIALN